MGVYFYCTLTFFRVYGVVRLMKLVLLFYCPLSLPFPVYTLFFSFFIFFIFGIIGMDIPFEEVTCFTPGGGNEAAEQGKKDRVGLV